MSSKGDGRFDRDGYAPVADRVALFYERYPAGRIITDLIERSERGVVFRASVFRTADERRPAATGWAAEREGDGEINTVACLENTETSAIGRALANLGFTASKQRASAEEMAKVARERGRRATPPALRDFLILVGTAERAGWPREDAERLRTRMGRGMLDTEERLGLEERLRAFLATRMVAQVAATPDALATAATGAAPRATTPDPRPGPVSP